MMPPSLFRNRIASAAPTRLTILLYAALGRRPVPAAARADTSFTATAATAAGAALLPFSVIVGLGSRWSGGLIDRIGSRLPLIVGPTVAATGFANPSVCPATPELLERLPSGLIVISIGMTVTIAPLDDGASTPRPPSMRRHRIGNQQRGAARVRQPRCDRRAGGVRLQAAAAADTGGMLPESAYRLAMKSRQP